MPIQAPQWVDYLNCPACCREFAPSRSPISLGCGHTLCRLCLNNLHRKQCPFDQTVISVELEELVVNTALLQLAGYTPPAQPYHPPCIQVLSEQDRRAYDVVLKCLEQLAVYLKLCGNDVTANNVLGSRLSRPMQRKLVTLLQCAMTDEEGRGKAARAARSLGDRTVTELIVQHQNPQQLSANLWAAVRSRGCQFLGPAMQEEVLKLVLLALEDGSALSRKVLVMFVVQRLEPHFPQASKTSIGHVVQLLYRASCFKVSKRVCDSSLMQLKEEFRTYDSLRREHDAQIVQIATEAGLRIAPDQWSALLYGDTQHKSHMQSIIDKLQTPQSFAQSVQELFITLQRTGDPAKLIAMSIPLDRLANIDASPDAKSPTWQQLSSIMTSLKDVVSGLVHFLQNQTTGRDANHNAKTMERLPEPPTQQSAIQGLPGRYKVAMCRDAQNRSYCPRGSNCTYAHSEEELERYRRINSANGNYQYLIQPGTPLAPMPRPIYQRYSVPPPSMPRMDNTFNMQASQPARGSMVLGSAEDLKREQRTYAAIVRQGMLDNGRIVGSSQGNLNGNINPMMPPSGRYYPRFADRPVYPYSGRISNEEMAQYAGMGGQVGPVEKPREYSPATMEYPQKPFIAENGPDRHFESLSLAISGPRSIALAQPQEPTWPPTTNTNTGKSPQMFKFDEKVKNLPLGMEIGKAIPIGAEIKNVPIGRDLGSNLAIGMDIGNNMPIGMPQTNGNMIQRGMEPIRKMPKQELEIELKALEKRISTEFLKASDMFVGGDKGVKN